MKFSLAAMSGNISVGAEPEGRIMDLESNIPAVGISFRPEAIDQTLQYLREFDALEVIVDHYLAGGVQIRSQIIDLSRRIPLVGHGVCLSLATAVLPDEFYLDQVAETLDLIGASWYSEHLAFTKVPGRDAAELLPVPRTRAMADVILRNLEIVRRHIKIPLALENISYYFEYPYSELSEREFLELICREGKTFLLLDLENVRINSFNHGFDPDQFVDALPTGLVRGVHMAGGVKWGRLMLDSHNKPVAEPVFKLLERLLTHQRPQTIILERDDDLYSFDEILHDVQRIKAVVASSQVARHEN
jgi:uncharacterized protein (UPF0276 family)